MGGSKPVVVPLPVWDNIPAELKERPQWVVWSWRKRADGEWTKPPYQAYNVNQLAKANDASTWSEFEAAQGKVGLTSTGFRVDGVGFELGLDQPSGPNPYTGCDFDNCLDADFNITDPRVVDFVTRLNSYTEKPLSIFLRVASPSQAVYESIFASANGKPEHISSSSRATR